MVTLGQKLNVSTWPSHIQKREQKKKRRREERKYAHVKGKEGRKTLL